MTCSCIARNHPHGGGQCDEPPTSRGGICDSCRLWSYNHRKRVYIAGPMTGIPQFNIPAFDAAARDLRNAGFDVVSPAELDDEETRRISLASPDGAAATLKTHNMSWGMFLARDIQIIADGGIEAIVVLPGWERSRGARLETFVGSALCGLPVHNLEGEPVPQVRLLEAWSGLFGFELVAVVRLAMRRGALS